MLAAVDIGKTNAFISRIFELCGEPFEPAGFLVDLAERYGLETKLEAVTVGDGTEALERLHRRKCLLAAAYHRGFVKFDICRIFAVAAADEESVSALFEHKAALVARNAAVVVGSVITEVSGQNKDLLLIRRKIARFLEGAERFDGLSEFALRAAEVHHHDLFAAVFACIPHFYVNARGQSADLAGLHLYVKGRV